MIIFTNYIPISLLVTQDLVKLAQAAMISGDGALYHEGTDTPTRVRCSDLNEELGQVEHVFSDKTGTLTYAASRRLPLSALLLPACLSRATHWLCVFSRG